MKLLRRLATVSLVMGVGAPAVTSASSFAASGQHAVQSGT